MIVTSARPAQSIDEENKVFSGSIVALITPMFEHGAVDWSRLEELIAWHLASDTDGFVVNGTTGESATLSPHEQRQLIEFTVKTVNGRLPVIAGTSAIAVNDAIYATTTAMQAGADGCLLLTPPYVKPTQEGLFRHYSTIAKAVPIPQILYNVPTRTGCDLFPETVERLSLIPNIVGIKEATGKVARAEQLISRCGERLDVLSGDDASALDLLFAGSKGVISVTANVAPQLVHDMCMAALNDDRPLARILNERIKWLNEQLFVESNPIPVKWALAEMQKIEPGIRLPLTWLHEDYHDNVRLAMRHAEVVE